MKVQPAFIGLVGEELDHQSHVKQWEYGAVSIDIVVCATFMRFSRSRGTRRKKPKWRRQ